MILVETKDALHFVPNKCGTTSTLFFAISFHTFDWALVLSDFIWKKKNLDDALN